MELKKGDYPEKEGSYYKYYLVGSVNRIINNGKDEFYYFARDPNDKNHWYESKGEANLENAPIYTIQETGQIIILSPIQDTVVLHHDTIWGFGPKPLPVESIK